MSIYAIGDIHGYFNKLEAILEKLPLTKDDKLIFLGDYVDRGPQSKEVIELLLQLRHNVDCVFLMGNHEHMLKDYLEGCKTYSTDQWLRSGGDATLQSYGLVKPYPENLMLPEGHLDFLKNLRYYHIEAGYVFVHAGLNWAKPIEKNTYQDLLWNRGAFITCRYKWPEGIVVFGHSQADIIGEPIVQDNKIGIDTGAGAGGMLTAVKLEEEGPVFYQV